MSEDPADAAAQERLAWERTCLQLRAHGDAYRRFCECWLAAAQSAASEELPVAELSRLLDPLEAALRGGGADDGGPPGDWLDWLSRALPVGEELRRLAESGGLEPQVLDQIADWRAALNGCLSHWRSLSDSVAGELQRRIDGAAADLTEIAQVYDLWVESFESCYSRLLRKPAFLRDQCRMLNAAFALQKAAQTRYQGLAGPGQPSRRELDAVARELQSLRRRLRDLEAGARRRGQG